MKTAGLNRSYRLVWSEVHQAFIAVAELVRSCGKGASKAAVVLASASVVQAGGLPAGGQVVAGAGAIAQVGQTMTITQHSEKMATDWQSFSIGKGQNVHFIQPSASSVALNRVLGSDVSVIQGTLNANGQVFVVNPNGVLFTPSAQVNVGALAASTLQLSTGDFLAGNYRFSGPSTAGVSNEGSIQVAAGGSVALIAARIENTGRITAAQGNVLLGAGSKVRLDLGGAVKLEVEEGALDTLITQGGAIRADGGLVYLTAKAAGDLASSVINHTGITEARSLHTGDKGQIMLMGDMAHGTVHVAGTLDASAGAGVPGGFIETSAQHVQVADGAQVRAAHWLIDPVDFTIRAGSDLQTASGIGAGTLATALGAGDVSIATDSGTGGNGDIFVNSAVTWNAASKLTLSAHRNIAIHADITAQHADGKVQLEYGQGAAEAGNMASYSFGGGRIHLRAGDNFFTRRGNDGAVTPWKVITEMGSPGSTTGTDLQGISGNLAGRYVLGADIDASATSGWNSNAGFMPLGSAGARFTGSFDGLGHAIGNLNINRPAQRYVGLFGYADNATLRNTGLTDVNVSGAASVGSLVGQLEGDSSIGNSYATGSVTGDSASIGGLAGKLTAFSGKTIGLSNSYAAVNVTGNDIVGGLVGEVTSFSGAFSLSNSYATGNVTASFSSGGLIGVLGSYFNSTTSINNSYATGNVSGGSLLTGGLLGWSDVGNGGQVNISHSFWNSERMAKAIGMGGATLDGASGKTMAELKTLSTFTDAGWDIDDAGGTGKIWRIYEGDATPVLRSFLTALTVTAVNNASRTYDATAYNSGGGYTATGADASKILYGGTAQGSRNAGNYTLSIYSNASGYDLIGNRFAPGGLTTGKKALTVTGMVANNKVYDGNAIAMLNGGSLTGLVGSETFNFSGQTGLFANKDAGDSKAVTVSGITLADGSNGGLISNYTVNNPTGLSANIEKKALTISGMTAIDKVYNGTSEATLTAGTLTGFVGSETVGISGQTGSFANPNAGGNKPVTVSGITLANGSNGGLAANYSVTSPTDVSASITQKPLTITADNASKTYGDADPTLTYAVTSGGLVAGDSLGGVLTRAPGENVGSYTIDANALANGNYLITAVNGALTIGQRPITVTADNQTKVYGNPDPALTYAVTAGSLVAGDSLGGILTRAPGENVGSYTIDANALANGNYLITAIDGTLSIRQRPITVTADNQTKVYGNADPALTYAVTNGSLVAGDRLNEVLTRDLGENAGSYTIRANALANGNYLITAIDGALSISQRPITVTADQQTKVYGNADPTLTYAVTQGSLVEGDRFNGALTRSSGENAGSYTIDASALANGNYLITAVDGALRISPRPITVTANGQIKIPGNADPALTYAITGGNLVAGDQLDGALSRSAGENHGLYAIHQGTLSQASNPNYQIAYVGAQLTIGADTQTAIGLGVQAASDVARSQAFPGASASGASSVSRTASLVADSSDAATRAREPSRLAPSGFVNVFVVQGGINMGANHAYSTQP